MSIWDKISYLYDVAVKEENVVGVWDSTVIAALIALAGVGIQIWIGYKNEKSNREFSKQQAKIQYTFEENESKKRLKFEEEWEQKRIDADIKAKARIEWIQNVRMLEVEFVHNTNMFLMNATSAATTAGHYMKDPYGDEKVVEYKRLIDKYVEATTLYLTEVRKNVTLLKLYFGKNDKDNEIISLSEKILENIEVSYEKNDRIIRNIAVDEIKKAESLVDEIIEKNVKQNNYLNNFVLKARDYNKTEWDRAKNGE